MNLHTVQSNQLPLHEGVCNTSSCRRSPPDNSQSNVTLCVWLFDKQPIVYIICTSTDRVYSERQTPRTYLALNPKSHLAVCPTGKWGATQPGALCPMCNTQPEVTRHAGHSHTSKLVACFLSFQHNDGVSDFDARSALVFLDFTPNIACWPG